MIERFAAAACGLDGNLNIFFDALLADVFAQSRRPDAGFDARIFVVDRTRNDARRLPSFQHSLCASVGHYGQGRAARPFGVLRICSAARSVFSKLAVEPASRFASATALSAARGSYPRLTSAEATSASMPAGVEAEGRSTSTVTASSLSFSSTTMRSAVLRPTPGILVNRARSLLRIAGTSSSTLIPDRIFSARDGPTPDADKSISKKCFSREERNPYSARASSRTCV